MGVVSSLRAHAARLQVVPGTEVEKLWKACLSNEFSQIDNAAQDVIRGGYSVNQILAQARAEGGAACPRRLLTSCAARQLQSYLVKRRDLKDGDKGLLAIRIADAEKKVRCDSVRVALRLPLAAEPRVRVFS